MKNLPNDDLDARLKSATQWCGEKPDLWRQALESASGRTGARPGFLQQRVPDWALLLIGAAALVGILAINLPHLGRLGGARQNTATTPIMEHVLVKETQSQEQADKGLPHSSSWTDGARFSSNAAGDRLGGIGGRFAAGSDVVGSGDVLGDGALGGGADLVHATGALQQMGQSRPPEPPGVQRQIIRKGSIELRTKDVRATVQKAALLISAAHGEYIETSNVTGEGIHTTADLTLRVAAERLSNVLNELRGLGAVASEKLTGEDVTAQIVDLEARLRNERRVETELLELLDTRKDAPLEDLLKLRSSISGVRQVIEQLEAQRQYLGRLVSLATILVIVRPEDAPPPAAKADPAMMQYFMNAVGTAWTGGLRFLADSLAGLVALLVGGAIWWAVLISAILLYRHRYLSRKQALGSD
jgi:hypothetical protein